MTTPVFDVARLHRALDTKRKAKEISWREAAQEMGVSASTLTRMAQGASPDVEGFAKMVAWLDTPADEFIDRGSDKPARKKKAPEDLMVVVSAHLRASKEFDERSGKALEALIEAAYRQMKRLKDE